MEHSDVFIFDNVIRITLKIPSIRIVLSIGSLNDKKLPFGWSSQICINISVCKSSYLINSRELISHTVVHLINEKNDLMSENIHFWVK